MGVEAITVWGVWQKIQIRLSTLLLNLPGPEMDMLCTLSAMLPVAMALGAINEHKRKISTLRISRILCQEFENLHPVIVGVGDIDPVIPDGEPCRHLKGTRPRSSTAKPQ
jgi:hypothetical protein